MGIIKTKGIVINTANSKDTDKILTILTPDLGKISVVVKNARKFKNTNNVCTQLFAFSELILYKNIGEIYVLNSAEIIEMFYNIRADIEKYYYVTYLCKLVCDISNKDENSYELLQLTLNTIYLFSENERENMFLITVFQIRILRLLGFTPILNKCANCNEEDVSYFSIRQNGMICKNCAKQDSGAIELLQSSINAIKYILLSTSKKVFSFEISNTVLTELKLFVKIYLREKLEKEYNIDKFLKDILI